MNKFIVGVMGPGDHAGEKEIGIASELGFLIANEGWILLSGGRNVGVMDAVNRGAKRGGGLTIGILPTTEKVSISEAVDIPILTGMGSARNSINVLTSDVVIACGMGSGTASEIALAIKANKDVILLNPGEAGRRFFKSLSEKKIHFASSPKTAISLIKSLNL